MNFREYFEEKLAEEILIDSLIEENILTAPFKAVAGGLTNLGYQSGRGSLGAGRGAIDAAYGLGKIGLGTLQTVTGDAKRGFKTARSGGGDIAHGAKNIASGLAKVGLSPVSALVRGVQASMEPIKPAEFDPKRGKFLDFFGLNSWRTPEERAKDHQDEFKKLIFMHSSAKTDSERKELRKIMKQTDPARYEALKRRAKVLQAAYFAKKAAEVAKKAAEDTSKFSSNKPIVDAI